jgi:MFS family permease
MKQSQDADKTEYSVRLVVGSLILGVFFGGVGGGVAFPTLPTLGTVLGISPFVVGIILSANRFTRLLMNAPAGAVIDRVGIYKPMVVGLFIQALTPFGYLVGLHADRLPVGPGTVFVLARLLWGIGAAFVFVGAFSTVIHVTTEDNRGKWIGYFRGGQSLGFPTGLVTGGVLTDLYSYEVGFLCAGASGLFAMVLAAFVLPPIHSDVETPARLRDIPAMVRADSRIVPIGMVNLAVRFLFAGVLLSTVVLYADTYGIAISGLSAVGSSGFFMAIAMLALSGTTFLSGRLSDRLDNRSLLAIPALGVFAFGFALLGAVQSFPAMVVGIISIGVGVGGTNPPLMAFLGDLSPDADVGKMGGIYNVFGDIGSTIGPLVALPVADAVGYRVEYLACAGLAALVLAVMVRTLVYVEPTTTTQTTPVTND